MRDLSSLTPKQILAIPLDWPEQLFDCDPDSMEKQYRKLAMLWHPDRKPEDGAGVFAHIQVLFSAAKKRLEEGTWRVNGMLKLKGTGGLEMVIPYRRSSPFELGHVYVADTSVTWLVEPEYEDLVASMLNLLNSAIHFHDSNMRKEHEKHIPAVLTVTKADKIAVTMRKDPQQVLLSHLVEHLGGKLPPRHVAWVISCLMNIACYFQYTGIVHNAIALDTVFVGPENHTASILGGWWYSARFDQRVLAVPARTLEHAPRDFPARKKATRKVDSALIRALGRELLGDPSGSKLSSDKEVPGPLAAWLRGVSGEDTAFGEYHTWHNKVLPDAFGPRRFVRLAVTHSDVYKEK